MRLAFVEAEKANHAVGRRCCAVGVSRAGFYAWCERAPARHAQRDTQLRVLVRASHKAYGRYVFTPAFRSESPCGVDPESTIVVDVLDQWRHHHDGPATPPQAA